MPRLKSSVLILGLAVGISLISSQTAQAQTFTIVHKFNGFPNDGRMPTAPVILDAQDNIYGTAYAAGKFGGGVVFKKPANGFETVLHNFASGTSAAVKNGANPAGLVQDAAGNLYGTTAFGGDLSCNPPTGCGTVFKLDQGNRLTVLHRFTQSNGSVPNADLLLDADGNLYGTTILGGGANLGTIFEINTTTGHLTLLKSFPNQFGRPTGSLAMDANGNLYGTASYGGVSECQCGVVFKLDTRQNLGDLFDFNGIDGSTPYGGVAFDESGDLVGTTWLGGNSSCSSPFGQGCGVVFKLVPHVSETTLYAFTGLADGANPKAGIILDSEGNLYGTTQYGGNTSTPGGGYGVAFKLDTSGNETVLHTFSRTDGAQPEAKLTLDSAENLYGTTAYGGSTACKNGCGIVFKVAP